MPDSFKNMMKGGWHPEKPGTTFKGQMGSLVGRKSEADKRDEERANHVARPISSLRDPASFAPPPKRDPRDPLPAISRTNTASSAGSAPQPPARAGSTSTYQPPAYEDSNRYASHHQAAPAQAVGQEEEPAPRKPWSLNNTGLKTDHLPPPPGRRSAGGPPPPPASRTPPASGSPGPPSLPPRLPPRGASGSSTPASAPSPPPQAQNSSYLPSSAVSRLGAAGVSVPGFGIGKTASPEPAPAAAAPAPANPQVNELQNRFSKLGKSTLGSSFGGTSQNAPAEGTTMEQKQAALRTASNFHKDPSSVSLADARASASTVNNFRQRHGEQVAAGARSASALNQKYGVADRLGGLAASSGLVGRQEQGVVAGDTGAVSPGPTSPAAAAVLGKKKPPPPPPKKKPGLGMPPPPAASDADDAPPPIPTATRPW